MIKAVIFDFFGVLEQAGSPNEPLLTYVRTSLKPKYKIGIISNAAADWVSEILSKEDIKLFDDIVLSHKVGFAKPEAAIYEIALKNLDVRADESVFIDDIEPFCVAARSLGMKAIWYWDFEQMKKELEKLLAVSDD